MGRDQRKKDLVGVDESPRIGQHGRNGIQLRESPDTFTPLVKKRGTIDGERNPRKEKVFQRDLLARKSGPTYAQVPAFPFLQGMRRPSCTPPRGGEGLRKTLEEGRRVFGEGRKRV